MTAFLRHSDLGRAGPHRCHLLAGPANSLAAVVAVVVVVVVAQSSGTAEVTVPGGWRALG